MQYLLIRWFWCACGNKSESLDGFSIGVKYVFKHWYFKSSLILHSLLSSFPDFLPIPGNFLVCLTIMKDPFRNLKAPFNYFLFLSLASTDLVVGMIMDPVSVAFHISEGLRLNIVDIKILHILYFILCTASILILMALTVERYVAVSSPVKYKTMVTSKRAII